MTSGSSRGWRSAFVAVVTAMSLALVSLAAVHVAPERLFETSGACLACHNGLTTSAGEDVSIGTAWRASMMANSARDPYWQASVQREIIEHSESRGEIVAECTTCHAPMLRAQARVDGRTVELPRFPIGHGTEDDELLAADGVSCTVCHQIRPDRLGTPESFNGGFVIDTVVPFGERPVFGKHEVDAGRRRIMHSASEFVPTQGAHVTRSELCATCHTLHTTARDRSGKAIGRLPEQVPFQEWKHSEYASEAKARSCQSCHMPAVAESVAISGVWGQPRGGLSRHDFRGGNFFMLRMLNRYRRELGVQALPQELETAANRTIESLQRDAATIRVHDPSAASGELLFEIAVRNLVGHKLPTAYPSRRVWLHVTVRDRTDRVVFESGAVAPDGSISGNDNDRDPAAFEPHYDEIRSAGQVQIYESIMADTSGRPTTGLLSAVRYVKDNRLLPGGFDKRTAGADVAVHGTARDDESFTAGEDRIRYRVTLGESEGPYRVDAALMFQPIAFRWADNLVRLRSWPGATAIERFAEYYQSMAHASAIALAKGSAATR